jgi:tetratricopeptide (TPR) repeat protein
MKKEKDIEALLEQGKWHFSRGFYQNAKGFFYEACQLAPKNSEALELYAKTLLEMNDWQISDEASVYLLRALKADPYNASAWNNLGKYYYSSGQLNLAVRSLTKALKHFPHNAVIMGNLACAYRKIHQFGKAFAYLQKAMEIDPESPWLHFQVGLTHLLKGYAYHSNIEYNRAKKAFQLIENMNLEFNLWQKPNWLNLVEIFLKVEINRKNVGILLNRFVPEHTPFNNSPWFSTQNQREKGQSPGRAHPPTPTIH